MFFVKDAVYRVFYTPYNAVFLELPESKAGKTFLLSLEGILSRTPH